jgi:trimethylamine:corrinoid methyltransferase-like protein
MSQSLEKLILDAEAIGMTKRMLQGIMVHTDTLATEMFEGIEFRGEFLKQRVTRQLVKKEQYLPSNVIDRGSIRTWQMSGSTDAVERAKGRVKDLLANYQQPNLPEDAMKEMQAMVQRLAKEAGMDSLPTLE